MNARSHRRAGLALVAAVATAMTAACGSLTPGSSSSGGGDGGGSSAAGKVLTAADVRKAGDITLHVSDYQSAGMLDALKKESKAFEKAYPNVKIALTTKAFDDYGKTIALAMSAKDAPDIAQANAAMAPRLVGGHLVRTMNDYYDGYHWGKDYPASIDGGLKADTTGKKFGSGDYWGMALGGNLVGVFYNAAKLQALGLQPPTTFAEFQSDLATAKAKGETPIVMGNLEQFPSNHVLSTLMNGMEKPQSITDWVNGQPGATFNTPETKQALTTLQDWSAKGYFTDQTNGTKDTDATAAFASGQGVFDITGSWHTSQFDQGLGDKGGFMLLPPMTAGGTSGATGFFSEAWTISKQTKHADVAAYFLNYLYGPESVQDNLAGGYLPFAATDTAPGGKVANDVLKAWRTAVGGDALSPYLDSATPAMGDAMFPALQALLGGKQTPDQVIQTVQGAWDSYHKGS